MLSKLLQFYRELQRWKNINQLGDLDLFTEHSFKTRVEYNIHVNGEHCKLHVGKYSQINGMIYYERNDAGIVIGANTVINNETMLIVSNGITIGDNVWISYQCLIIDNDGHSPHPQLRRKDFSDLLENNKKDWSVVSCKAVHIEDDAWIGARSIILKGVRIGKAAIVAAGAVVVNDVPDYTIVAGNPATKIGTVEDMIKK